MSSPQNLAFCTLAELQAKKSVTKWMDELRDELIAIIDEEKITVLSSVCPHFGGTFNYECSKKELVCNWHGFKFDAHSGKCTFPYNKLKLRHYEHRVVNGTVEITLS